MENKNRETVSPTGVNGGVVLSTDNAAVFGDVPEDLSRDSDALSLNPELTEPVNLPESAKGLEKPFWHFAKRTSLILLAIIALGLSGIYLAEKTSKQQYNNANPNYSSTTLSSRFGTVKLPLSQFISSKSLSVSGSSSVTINGSTQLNDGLIVTPSIQPTGAKPGQIYYDQSTNQLAYYNGQNFVFLSSAGPTGLQSLGGATGQIALGSGLTLASGKLANSGVLSVQGQNGAVSFTAGSGININGTNLSNGGVLNITSGSPDVSISNNGVGNVAISVTPGAGAITTSGGTVGTIPVYTTSQNIEDSLINQSGSTVNVNGNLSVVSGDLTLDNALTVANGGTGSTALAANGILVGQGTSSISSIVSGSTGLCLISTSGLPNWENCPGGNPNVVTSLNSLIGDLNIADASTSGDVITLDNASTSGEGIASFNGNNFTVSGGAVNTIQNINSVATPTFAGIDTNSITPSSALTVGSTSQALTLQGSASTVLTATNGSNTTTLSFANPTANVTYVLQAEAAGSYNICTSEGNCLGGAGGANTALSNLSSVAINTSLLPGSTTINLGSNAAPFNNLFIGGSATDNFEFTGSASAARTITIPDASGTLALSASGNIALSGAGNITFTGQLPIANGGTGSNTAAGARSDLSAAASGANSDITSLSGLTSITPSSALTVGSTSQALTLQGSASTVLTATNGSNTTTLSFANPTANVTYVLQAEAAGSYNICTSEGNCLGGAGGANTALSNLSSVAINTSLLPGSTTINLGSNAAPFNNLFIGGSATDNFEFTGSASAARTITIPDASGTLALSASGNIALSGAGNITFTGQLPIANGGTGSNTAAGARSDLSAAASGANSDITSLSGLTTALSVLQGGTGSTTAAGARSDLSAAASGANSDITSLSGLTTALSVLQGGTGSTTAAGARSDLSAAASGANSDITSLSAVTAIDPSAALTVGSVSQAVTITGNTGTTIIANSGGFSTNFNFQTPTANVVYQLQTATAGTYNICTTAGNCLGGGSGGANTSLSNLTGVAINTSLLPGSTTINLGSNAAPFNNLFIGGSATDNFEFTGSASAARTITIPDASGTICLSTGNCLGGGSGGANTALSNLSSVAINTSLLPGSTTINLGSNAAPFNNLFIGGSATDNFEFTGSASAARTITIPDASGTLALSASGNIALSGAGNITFTGQLPIANGGTGSNTAAGARSDLSAAASGANSDITSLSGLTSITPSSALTVGSTSQALTLQGSASTVLTATNGSNTTTLSFANPTANVTYVLQAEAAGSYNICTSEGNCLGGAGGANTALSNLSSVAINTSLLPGSTTINLGSNAAPFNNLFIGGSATDNFEFTGSASAARTITIPDASGTLALSASGNIALSGAGNITFTGQLPIANGGTGSNTAAGARSDLSAAASGANSDITSLSGLTTALSVLQGGTGSTTLNTDGVLYGGGTSSISATASGTTGQCLLGNTSAAPTWGSCSGGVTLQAAYNNSSSPASIVTTSSSKYIVFQAGTSDDSTSLFQIQNSGGTPLLNVDSVNSVVDVGATGTPTQSGSALYVTSADFSGAVLVGTSTNNVQFNASTFEPTLSGTARHTETILLTAEYAGAVLDAGTGSNNTGDMISDIDATNRENYFQWTTNQSSSQSYDVVVQVPIPSGFSAWASTTPLTVDTETSNTTNGTIGLQVLDTTGTAEANDNFANITPSTTNTWQTMTAGSFSGTYTAGGFMTLRIRMYATSSVSDVRIGNIKLTYLSKY